MCKAASTALPAVSAARGSHCPQPCRPARTACSHSLSGLRPSIAFCRRCTAGLRPGSAASRPMPSRQKRVPFLRSRVSADLTSAGAKAGAFFSQSSTASAGASAGSARKKPMNVAAARVVDSVQPVSSRRVIPRVASTAPTRRVNKRSCATRATGLRPAARCASTHAAARCASSSASIAGCNCGPLPCCSAGAVKASVSVAATARCCRASVNGSACKPLTTNSISTGVLCSASVA